MTLNEELCQQLLYFLNNRYKADIHTSASTRFKVKHLMHGGSNFVALLLDGRTPIYVVKVANEPRRSANLLNEFCKRSILQNYLPSLVTKPVLFHKSNQEFKHSFLVLRYQNGKNVEELLERLSPSNLTEVVSQMGTILGDIHSIQGTRFEDSEGNAIDDWASYVEERIHQSLSDSVFCHLVEPFFTERLRRISEERLHLLTGEIPVLIHKDYQFRNVLVMKRFKKIYVTGIIDLESSFWGPSSFDFPIIKRFLFDKFSNTEDAFVGTYRFNHPKDDNFDERVYLHDLFQSIRLIRRAIRRGENGSLPFHIHYLHGLLKQEKI